MTRLSDPRLQSVLRRLHAEAAQDPERWAERRAEQARRPPPPGPDPLVRMGRLYLALSQDEGRLLYLLTRAMQARRAVEFGASYGVSTLYLAAALSETGGELVTTEAHPDKCAALRASLDETELSEQVTLLEGDARETLATVEGPIDLLLLDGWKSQYLPVLELLLPRLRPGALIVADNFGHEAAADYRERVTTDPAFVTEVVGQLALSSWVG